MYRSINMDSYNFFPLHVWNRELDSRLVLCFILAQLGQRSIIGHEYNISPYYKISANSLLFRAGSPIDHPVRGKWHETISKNNGIVITHNEEGVNNMPLIYANEKDSYRAELDNNNIYALRSKASPKALNNVTAQLAWGRLHRILSIKRLENIQSRTIAMHRTYEASSIRFDLLGHLGFALNSRLIDSINNIFGRF